MRMCQWPNVGGGGSGHLDFNTVRGWLVFDEQWFVLLALVVSLVHIGDLLYVISAAKLFHGMLLYQPELYQPHLLLLCMYIMLI